MLAVGVPMETVISDYMKTNEYTKEFVDDYLKKIALLPNQADVDQLRPIMAWKRDSLLLPWIELLKITDQ